MTASHQTMPHVLITGTLEPKLALNPSRFTVCALLDAYKPFTPSIKGSATRNATRKPKTPITSLQCGLKAALNET